ncbi:MAG: DUF3307 domain-containing protein [Lachnospiraceae bacterium]|nr:DUF3307 domain-containing protein [Lachnospiraceae bacterium]
MIIKYLLILGIGHLFGDFYFQNEKIAEYKEVKYQGVLLHSIEYCAAFLLTILPVFSIDMVIAVVYAALAHFLIDTVKYFILLKKKVRKNFNIFIVDQCAHIVSIFVLAYTMDCWHFTIGQVKCVSDILSAFHCNAETIGRWILALLAIHTPANIFIQKFLGEYKPKKDEDIIKMDNKAGRRIGTLERFIMLIFLSKDQFTALGFVLTAKSIARYDKITKDEKFAEYYLRGTLVSTLYVIICRVLIWV